MIHAKDTTAKEARRAREYLAGWKRARAELDNLRKNMAMDYDGLRQRSVLAAVEPILPLADNFRAMAAHVPPELKNSDWAQGVLHIARQLDGILKSYGVEAIGQRGDKFNPSQHEAVAHARDKELEAGLVVEVVQAGYKLGDKVLRPAKVKVNEPDS